jgi:hypothetical protein
MRSPDDHAQDPRSRMHGAMGRGRLEVDGLSHDSTAAHHKGVDADVDAAGVPSGAPPQQGVLAVDDDWS